MVSKYSAAAVAVALVAAARLAHADPVADFKSGTTVTVRLTTADAGGGPRTNPGVQVAKAAGRLDFELQAADLGIDIPITLHLRGASVGSGRILYTIDDSYSPAVDLGNRQLLSRVTGQLLVVATSIPGADNQREGSVRLLSPDSSGYLEAYGSWGTRRISISDVDLIGGVVRPLVSFVDQRERLCSDRVRTTRTLTVTLASAAPADGADVDLHSSPRGGVHVPPIAHVPAGRRSAPVTTFIDANFVGVVRVSAASGGVTRNLDLVVRPHRECE